MNISILGTGIVGRSHAHRLMELQHTIAIGTQNIEKTLAETKTDPMGNIPFSEWQKENPNIALQKFEDAAAKGEIVINALRGDIAVRTLSELKEPLRGKILIDISNPLDFSHGFPPSLSVCNTDSLGEQIQGALPDTHIVKTFNTVNAGLQVNPTLLANGNHTLFMCGNNADAKSVVRKIQESYGWSDIIDLGDITGARGMEMTLPFWLRLFGAFGTATFNYRIVIDKENRK